LKCLYLNCSKLHSDTTIINCGQIISWQKRPVNPISTVKRQREKRIKDTGQLSVRQKTINTLN
jgi:hypothetical protein